MTSKEALEESKYILKNLKTRSIEYEQDAVDFHERVIKDLEVLEILKKHFSFKLEEKSWTNILSIVDTEDLEQTDGIDCTATTCLNVQDSKIIKEWLND